MEEEFENIKAFILETVNDYIEELSTEDCPMNKIKCKDIVFGAVDLSRYEDKIICAIVPDSQDDAESELSANILNSNFTVSFLCRGYNQEILVKQMCRYAAAFRHAVLDDETLGGFAQNAFVGTRTFFSDAGTVEKQMTVSELEFTCEIEEEIE